MSAVRRFRRLTRQPQYAAPIDWGNPELRLFDGFWSAHTPSVWYSRTRGVVPTTVRGTLNPSPVGLAQTFTAASSHYIDLETLPVTTTFRLFGLIRSTSVNSLAICSSSGSSAGGFEFLWGVGGVAGTNSCRMNSSGTNASFAVPDNTAYHAYLGTHNNTSPHLKFYTDGVFRASAVNVATAITHTQALRIASRGSTYWSGDVALVGWGYSALSTETDEQEQAARSLHLNPWQIFRAPSRRLWVVPSGGASYDIAGDTVGEGATTGEISVIGAVSIAGATSGEGVTAGAITFTLPSFSIAADTVGEGATTGAITTSTPTYDIAGVTTGEGVSTGEISVSVAYSIAGDTVGEGVTAGEISLAGTYAIAGATVGEGVTEGAIEVPAVYFIAADTVGEGVTAGSIELAGTYSLQAATEGEGATTGAISILATYAIAGATAGEGVTTGSITIAGEDGIVWYRTGPNSALTRRASRNVTIRR